MRIIRRTLAILAAALLVVGITFGVAQSSRAPAFTPDRPGRRTPAQSQSDGGTINAGSAQSSDRPVAGFEHRESRSPSLFGAIEIANSLAIVGVIVALVVLTTGAASRFRPKGQARGEGAQPPQ